MYRDKRLIQLKMIGFNEGVNFSSRPEHHPHIARPWDAFNIAGKGITDPRIWALPCSSHDNLLNRKKSSLSWYTCQRLLHSTDGILGMSASRSARENSSPWSARPEAVKALVFVSCIWTCALTPAGDRRKSHPVRSLRNRCRCCGGNSALCSRISNCWKIILSTMTSPSRFM